MQAFTFFVSATEYYPQVTLFDVQSTSTALSLALPGGSAVTVVKQIPVSLAYQNFGTCTSNGDPHTVTFDGVYYSMHVPGELTERMQL